MYAGKTTKSRNNEAKDKDMGEVSVCRPNTEYHKKQIAKFNQAVDMIDYLMNEGYVDYSEGAIQIGRLLIRIRDNKKSMKTDKKRYKDAIRKQKIEAKMVKKKNSK